MSVDLIKLNKDTLRGKKPKISPTQDTWICGGAIRQWFLGNEKTSDIDIFGKSEEALNKFTSETLKDAELINENKFTKSYDLNGQMVQVIYGVTFPSIEEAFDSFDFNICQFGYDGESVFSTPNSVISALRRHLGSHKIRPEFAADSLRRAFKYQKKGYIPCAGTLKDLGQAFVGLTKGQIEEQIVISPNGGRRIVRFD